MNPFIIFCLVLYTLLFLYLFIRSLIDPKFAEKLSEINRRERERKGKQGKELGNLGSMQQMAVGHHGVIAMEAQKVDIIMYWVIPLSFK